MSASAQPGAPRSSVFWKEVDEHALLSAALVASSVGDAATRRNIVPQSYRTLELDRAALKNVLAAAPAEFSGPIEKVNVEVSVPLPDGTFGRFNVQESPVMEPKLAAKFPEIKTYVGQGIEDPTATIRMDVTPAGFHAVIFSPAGQVFVDPYWRDSDLTYVSYRKSDFVADKPFSCLVDSPLLEEQALSADTPLERPTGAALRLYRLALACTGEYATAVSSPSPPTVSRALAAIITSANRVSAVYERELSIRFLLVADNDKLIYLNGATDPYTNADGVAMLSQNQTTIDSVVGVANYDFGHVFSTGGGGVAQLRVPCGSDKARGVTGLPNPTGDPYDIDFVAHEMGHQFGGNHTFNSTVGNCGGGNRVSTTAYEVGSGTTIMAYAGICGATNLADHSDDYFHTANYTEIDNFTSNASTGGSCPATVATGNQPPVIAALLAYTIPSNTPFALTGSATDADGDIITYDWEEFDLGMAQTSANPSSTSTNPLFRSYSPTVSPTRFFPSLTYILNNANIPPALDALGFATGEVLPNPNKSRTMTFRLTARDNRAGGGGSNWAQTTVTVEKTGAAFLVISPD
ncbi:MAG: M12 family metallo-peptidase, partial [Verrucomicrobiota bacterium]|nr:M12 family metallo-peptidase [Verrucomicrobiota bacterium]